MSAPLFSRCASCTCCESSLGMCLGCSRPLEECREKDCREANAHSFHAESAPPSGLSPRDAQRVLRPNSKRHERDAIVMAKRILVARGYKFEEAHVRPFRIRGRWYTDSADFWKAIDLMGKADRPGLHPRYIFLQVTDLTHRANRRRKVEEQGPWFSDGDFLEVEVWAWDPRKKRMVVDRMCPLGWQLAVDVILAIEVEPRVGRDPRGVIRGIKAAPSAMLGLNSEVPAQKRETSSGIRNELVAETGEGA